MGTFRPYPKHLGKRGEGYTQCERSGFLRKASDLMKEDKGATVAEEFADKTPGFGTWHPQDVNQAEVGSDPTPIDNSTGVDMVNASKADMGITDAEVLLAIQEDRPPRPGF